ncbi:hypothetical protein HPB51_023758 [Rhipicephalus microplus]|uniref:Uncharacterized protein n=1 Tax=Rhipicephalus microplus TaxID=6941 RepID=A0A9J6E576_RHIMP|nr:hypothetical protein HPB51_023758 [Rhipicephalus microplus]
MLWCLSLCLLIVTWTLLGTVPVPLAWLLPFFVLPLAGVTSISDLSHMFMEDSLLILLLGMNVLVAVGEETALCSRVALYVIEAFGLRLRGILLGITGVTFLSAQLLMGGSATLLMCAVVEATMFELQHDIIAATIAHGKRRNVRTTVGGDVVMTPVHVMIISPRKTPSSGTSLDDDEDDFDEMDESSEDDEDDMRPRVLVPSMAPFDARNPGAYYQLHGSVPDDPRYIVSMDAVIPEIEENEDPNAPKKSPILRHRNTAKVFLLEAHRFHKIKKALLINVAHTSAVGCMATILGSTSGLYLRDYFHFTYGYDAVTALSWTLLALPVAAVSVLLCAFITYYLFLRSYDPKPFTAVGGVRPQSSLYLSKKEDLAGRSATLCQISHGRDADVPLRSLLRSPRSLQLRAHPSLSCARLLSQSPVESGSCDGCPGGNATIINECSTTECQHCTRRWR